MTFTKHAMTAVRQGHLPANQIAESTRKAGSKDSVSCRHVVLAVQALLPADSLQLRLQDDSHDHSIDSHCFTEDDAAYTIEVWSDYIIRWW